MTELNCMHPSLKWQIWMEFQGPFFDLAQALVDAAIWGLNLGMEDIFSYMSSSFSVTLAFN